MEGIALHESDQLKEVYRFVARQRFPSADVRLQSRSFARWNPRLTEIAQVHGCFSSQSFWKAGSARKGSQIGSSLRRAGVMALGP